jgi:anti-sigma factor RsiW
MFFAMWRAMYEAERSTFVGSLPEKAPPPWLPTPP